MTTNGKRGRPALASKRDKWLPVRVSAGDIATVRAAAAVSGMTVSAWVRMRLALSPSRYGAKCPTGSKCPTSDMTT